MKKALSCFVALIATTNLSYAEEILSVKPGLWAFSTQLQMVIIPPNSEAVTIPTNTSSEDICLEDQDTWLSPDIAVKRLLQDVGTTCAYQDLTINDQEMTADIWCDSPQSKIRGKYTLRVSDRGEKSKGILEVNGDVMGQSIEAVLSISGNRLSDCD